MFYGCKDAITSISFEKGSLLKSISKYCFAQSALESVDMSSCSELTFLNAAVFYQCAKLSSIKLPPNLIRIGTACFQDTTNLIEIELPDSVTTLDGSSKLGRTFGNSAITRITISRNSNLTTIGSDVFANSNLDFFFIPSLCTKLDPSSLAGCPLNEIAIDERNQAYKTDGKIIYSGAENNTLFFVSSTKTGSFTIPSFVTRISSSAARGASLSEIIMHDDITNVYSWCFSGNPIITFSFPKQITLVASSMFRGCRYLTTVYFTKNITVIQDSAFYDCFELKNIELPPNLTEIGNSAFYKCRSLTHISLPESLQTLGDGVFNLITNIEIDSQNPNFFIDEFVMYRDNNQTVFTYLGSNTNYDVIIRSDCTAIASNTFLSKKLKNVYFENNENMEIRANAFDYSTIVSIEMPPGLSLIGDSAFSNCQNLVNVTFQGNKLTTIPDYCFYNSKNLKYITLPKSIEKIGNYAFQDCTNLGDIGLSSLSSLNSIGISAFMSSGLTTANLPNSLNYVGTSAFNNSKIQDLSISCNISQMMCQYCTSLTTLDLREGVFQISLFAFNGCKSLEGFTIPKTLLIIGSFSFQNCEQLSEVNMVTNCNLKTVEGGCFTGCFNLKEIKLSPAEANFSFYNGALMNYIQTKLIVFIPYSEIKNFMVPSEMEVIGSYAFMGSPQLMRVFFSGSKIKRIDYQAFKNCPNLNFVFFASSKIDVAFGSEVFSGCYNLVKCGGFSAPSSVRNTLIAQGIPKIAFNNECDISVTCKIQPQFKISTMYLFPFIQMLI